MIDNLSIESECSNLLSIEHLSWLIQLLIVHMISGGCQIIRSTCLDIKDWKRSK